MLDIKFVRDNPEVVKQNIKNKFQDHKLPLVDEVIELDEKNRKIKQEVEALRAEKNSLSKLIGGLMKDVIIKYTTTKVIHTKFLILITTRKMFFKKHLLLLRLKNLMHTLL